MRARFRRYVGFGVMVGLVASLMFSGAVSADRDDNHNWSAILQGGNEAKVGDWAQWGSCDFRRPGTRNGFGGW